MRRSRGFVHPVARRVALASMTVLASSGIGLIAAPMAFGQIIIPIGGPIGGSSQGASVTNAGSASANTGGNTAVGNNSQNNATVTQDGNGSLIGIGVSLGGPTNNSTGTATVNTGAANAAGNVSDTQVGQAAQRGAGGSGPGAVLAGGGGACGPGRFASFQDAGVSKRGEAQANTGNNTAVGNASTNDASVTAPQTVSGGLLGVGITIGGPVNNSSGTAVINTGPATAVGNDSATNVGQSVTCPQGVLSVAGGTRHVVVPAGHVVAVKQPQHRPVAATLARTGLDTADLGMIAGALLGAGMLLVASQRRRMVARSAAVPMAGFGFGLGGDR